MSIIIGVDGGINGGLAAYWEGGRLDVDIMPVITVKAKKGNKKEYNIPAIRDWLSQWRDIRMVILERAQAYPAQGSVSNFTIGRCFGILEGILTTLKLPYTVVHARTWQAQMFKGLAHADTKQASVLVAQRLFPEAVFIGSAQASKLHNGMTDAALMAYYGFQLYHV